MKRKGFTLVELLATIVILALIIIVIVPNALKSGTSIKQSSLEAKKENILSAAQMYGDDKDEIFDEYEGCLQVYSYEYIENGKNQVEDIVRINYDEDAEYCYSYAVVSVEELADDKYIKYDEDKVVTNPADSESNLNKDIIYLYKKNKRIYGLYQKDPEELKKKNEKDDDEEDKCTGSNCEKPTPSTEPKESCDPNTDKNCCDPNTDKNNCRGDDEILPEELVIKKEPDKNCTAGLKRTTYSSEIYSIPCSGKYRIEYVGGSGGNGEGDRGASSKAGNKSRIYTVDVNLSKNTPITNCPGKKGKNEGACSWADVNRSPAEGYPAPAGDCSTKGHSYTSGGLNTCGNGGNGGSGRIGSCQCGSRNAGDWGPWYPSQGSSGSGGAATYFIIPTAANDASKEIVVSASGAAGAGASAGGGGAGGSYSSKNTSGLTITDTGRNYAGDGYISYYLVEANGDDGFIIAENCPKAETVLIDSTTNKYVSIFLVNCTGKYKIELAGASGGSAANSSVVGGTTIKAEKPEGGQVITTTINLKLGDIVSYGLGRVGGSPFRGTGGDGGAPNGSKGGDGIYGIESKVLISSGGGGGGGASVFSVNYNNVLTADGGKGAKGGYLELYPPGSGGKGGKYNIDMSMYPITQGPRNSGNGYIKITYIP